MNKIRTFVVDDEPPARRRLLELLEREPDIEIAGAFAGGAEAVEAIAKQAPDLLFLDVQMPGLDGFALLESVDPERQPITIFVTAYDAYALKAFEVKALDYLLKPFSDERFEDALARGRERIRSRRLLSLVEGHSSSKERQYAGRLVVRNRGQIRFIDVSDVEWKPRESTSRSMKAAGSTWSASRSRRSSPDSTLPGSRASTARRSWHSIG
ncbi:MAG TPA: response regulator [Vicinamibacteria bacterium]